MYVCMYIQVEKSVARLPPQSTPHPPASSEKYLNGSLKMRFIFKHSGHQIHCRMLLMTTEEKSTYIDLKVLAFIKSYNQLSKDVI